MPQPLRLPRQNYTPSLVVVVVLLSIVHHVPQLRLERAIGGVAALETLCRRDGLEVLDDGIESGGELRGLGLGVGVEPELVRCGLARP